MYPLIPVPTVKQARLKKKRRFFCSCFLSKKHGKINKEIRTEKKNMGAALLCEQKDCPHLCAHVHFMCALMSAFYLCFMSVTTNMPRSAICQSIYPCLQSVSPFIPVCNLSVHRKELFIE